MVQSRWSFECNTITVCPGLTTLKRMEWSKADQNSRTFGAIYHLLIKNDNLVKIEAIVIQ